MKNASMSQASEEKDLLSELRAISKAPRRFSVWLIDELRWFCRVIISSADRFYWDNGLSKSASLAYTTLLSIVPAMALAFGLFASFAVSSTYVHEARRFIFKQFVPDLATVDTILEYLTTFSNSIASYNALAIFFIVITSLLLLSSIEYAINEVWQVFESRSIAHRIQIYSAIILIFPVLLFSGTYLLTQEVDPYLKDFPVTSMVHQIYHLLLPFLIDYLAFTSLYYLVPKAPVKFRSAAFGAFLAAILFGLAKALFGHYITKFSSYGTVYSTVAAVPIFLFWLYIAWTVVLYGAEVSYQAQHLPRTGKLWKRSLLSNGDGQLVLGVQALVMISNSFIRGIKPPSDLEVAESLGCSTIVLKPALDRFEKAGIIARGDSRDAPLTLLRSPDKILLDEVRKALFSSRPSVHYPQQLSRLFTFLGSASLSDQSGRTLADIISRTE